MNIIFDMETADPDDALTLCFLAGHPRVNLRAVTITPGSRDQVGVVRHLLKRLNREDVEVGARNIDHPKECVSAFHYNWLGKIAPSEAKEAYKVMYDCYQQYPDSILLTGAALHNPKNLLNNYPDVEIPLWVGQGGFAGEGVVPQEYQLAKFLNKKTCPTFNFNGDSVGAKLMLSSTQVKRRLLVSKNVCHGVIYNHEVHEYVSQNKNNNPGIALIHNGMEFYLKKNTCKAFHDPLAACVMINENICEFKEVEVFREKGEWGSSLKKGTNTFISIKVDMGKFLLVLTGA